VGKEAKGLSAQREYARVLDIGMKIGLVAIIITFIIYLSGIFTPYIPVNDLPKYWGLSVHKYLEETGIHQGWSWVGMLDKGDFLNFTGIAFLAGVTVICYLRIIPIFFKKKDFVYGIFAIIEVLVLVLAASGLLKVGGH
jgi:hypothetical protein